MKSFQRAYLSVVKRPVRNLILLLIVFLISNLVAGSYLIQKTTDTLENDFKESVGAYINISSILDDPKNELVYSNPLDANRIYDELTGKLEEMKTIDHVTNVDYKTINSLDYFNTFALEQNGYCTYMLIANLCHEIASSGVHSEQFADLEKRNIDLTEGRNFTQDEIESGALVALISDNDLIQMNGKAIKVGDKIPYKLVAYDHSRISHDEQNKTALYSENDYLVEVIGMFSVNYANQSKTGQFSYELEKHVFLPDQFLLNMRAKLHDEYIEAKGEDDLFFNTGFITLNTIQVRVDSPDHLEAVNSEISSILADTNFPISKYITSTMNDDFDAIHSSVSNLQELSKIIFYSTIVVSVFVLALIITIILKDRKQEVGILMALGEVKLKIVQQFLLEILVIGILGISLSLLSSNYVADLITTTIFNREPVISEQEESLSFSLDTSDVRYLYGIVLSTLLIASSVPLIYNLNLDPKKVLMDN